MSEQTMCACGKPLHYSSPELQRLMQKIVDEFGEDIRVRIDDRVFLVQRHYLALHGLRGVDLPNMNFPEVTGE